MDKIYASIADIHTLYLYGELYGVLYVMTNSITPNKHTQITSVFTQNHKKKKFTPLVERVNATKYDAFRQ